MAQMLTWNDVLDDESAEERPCSACKGRGTDRHGEDCDGCDGFGVQI